MSMEKPAERTMGVSEPIKQRTAYFTRSVKP